MTTLGPICSFLNGGTPSRGVSRYYQGDVPWITGANISGARADTARSFITEEAIRESATNWVPAGTVLLVTRTSVGKVAVAAMDLCFSQDITAITPDPHCLDTSYLVHFLRTKRPHLERLARGATIKGVTREVVANLAISLPPLAEQKRIAGILDAADAVRAKRREALAELDSLLQSTFLDMFGDPVTNPMGWEVKPLNELLGEKSTNGAYYPKDAYSSVGTRMVHMANAFYGVVNPNEVKRVDAPLSDIEKYGLLPTDILVSRRSLNYEGSAKPCLIPETDEPLIFESSLIRVRPDRERVLTIYLFHYLLNDRVRAKHVFPLVTRSTISGISQSNLIKVKVVLPPLDLQLRFAAVVESIEQQKTRQRAHLTELDTLFASLQSRAFRGDL